MPVLLVKVRAQNPFRLAENILHLLCEKLRRKDDVVIADVLTNLRLLPVIIGRPDQLDTAVLERIQITINQKVGTALINNRHLIK